MPIAQDKLSKFGINLRGECQLCSLLLHCIQHSATQQNMGHKMQGCFLNLMKFSKGSKTFFLPILVSSPFLLCVVFNGAKRTLHQEPRDGIFWLASNLGLVFINFGDFYSSGLPTCQFPCLTFWQNCHMIILKNSTHSKWLIFQSSNWFWHFQF